MTRSIARIAVLSVAVLLCTTGRTSAHDPTTKVTYTREIVRLLDQHCVGCHRAGGSAPMAFTSYAEARPWAHAMKEMVLDREMPPWPAAPGYGDFENDPTLTPFEAGLLAAWADGGFPKGEAGDMPVAPTVGLPPSPPGGFGGTRKADATYEISWPAKAGRASVALAASASADRWIAGWDFRPGPRVRQADLFVSAGNSEQRLGAWVPPGSRQMMPAGSAQRLPAGASIRLAVDLGDGDASASDGGTLRVWLAAAPPERRVEHQTLGCGRTTIDRDVSAFAIRPHVQSGAIEVTAQTADGAIQPLIVISAFDVDYQPTYRFRRPVVLPKGSVIDARGAAAGCEIDLALLTASRQP